MSSVWFVSSEYSREGLLKSIPVLSSCSLIRTQADWPASVLLLSPTSRDCWALSSFPVIRIRHEFIEKGKPQQNGFSISYTELSSEDIFLYYLNRWSIESYFKTAKQHFLQEFLLNSIFRYSGLWVDISLVFEKLQCIISFKMSTAFWIESFYP